METFYDFISVAGFAGILVLYFHFNKNEDQNIMAYIWPSIGCAISNYFGNKGFGEVAAIVFIAALLYVWFLIWKKGGVPDSDPGDE